ncbi:glycoside hydrolase family 3 protein [Streptomyces sp. NPDC090499]|uniref:glycoside hydrolase family 3 protein n=1 Tax=Streptomyces sp. NPDC090499 TaxID=3365965 RepID=UPI00380E7702
MSTCTTAGPDLRALPFGLDERQVRWVEEQLSALSVRQKVGQVMCPYLPAGEAKAWTRWLRERDIEPGAVMLTRRSRSAAAADIATLQEWSRLPMLVAANLEAGAGTVLDEEISFGNPMQIAASRDPLHAHRLAVHCARIANEIGVNWAFAPVVDIALNSRNPITNTRAFSDDPALVAELSTAFVRELEQRSIATSVKHFPGDGIDGRDQHLLATNNDQTLEEWRNSFEPVYRSNFAAGARTVMVGHIRHPAWSRELVPGIQPGELLPASLAHELATRLLRDHLGFAGLVVTDNSAMAGMTTVMDREQAVPMAITAGCDMLLGNVDFEEDFTILLDAVETGVLPLHRLDSAVRTVLALKASIGLNDGTDRTDREQPAPQEEDQWRTDLARASATLVKDTLPLLPLSAQTHRRALVYVLGDGPTYYDPSGSLAGRFVAGLEKRGLEVTVRHIPGEDRTVAAASRLHDEFDVCLYFANVRFMGNSNTLRVTFSRPQAPDAPRHVRKLPTALVSVADPYLLQDMPMIKTAVNSYTPTPASVDACLEVLFGELAASGQSPVDAFAGHWDAAL